MSNHTVFYIPNTSNSLPYLILDKLGIRGGGGSTAKSSLSSSRVGAAPPSSLPTGQINFKVWTSPRPELGNSRLYTLSLNDGKGRPVKTISTVASSNSTVPGNSQTLNTNTTNAIISTVQTQSFLTILGKCKNLWVVRQQAFIHLVYNANINLSYGVVNVNGNERGLVIFYSKDSLLATVASTGNKLDPEVEEVEDDQQPPISAIDASLEEFIRTAIENEGDESMKIPASSLFSKFQYNSSDVGREGDVLQSIMLALQSLY